MKTQTCGCDYPMVTKVADELVSRRRKANGLFTIDRYVDCLVHGPQKFRTEVNEFDGRVVAAHRVGEPLNRSSK